jgi:alpha-amylase
MLQGFEWYLPADGSHWRRLERVMPVVAQLGVTRMWIPPACKAAARDGNGYDLYDLWDLGEFEQKFPGKGTKWGTKEELVRMAEVGGRCGVKVLFDAVLNHKTGADFCEWAMARRVEDKDRGKEVVGGRGEIQAWTGFEFPGRRGQYSKMRWNRKHFTGVDYDSKTNEKGVWKFDGKKWADDVDEELGNYDFLWVTFSS